MIIGLCQYVIPDDEVRKIKHLRVFFVTATWSVFAYIWLYVILGKFLNYLMNSLTIFYVSSATTYIIKEYYFKTIMKAILVMT